MRLFPMDIVSGVMLAIALVMTVLGIVIYRYRRGPGPVLLIVSGVLILLSSLLDLLITTDVLDIWEGYRYIMLVSGIIFGIASLVLWRR